MEPKKSVHVQLKFIHTKEKEKEREREKKEMQANISTQTVYYLVF